MLHQNEFELWTISSVSHTVLLNSSYGNAMAVWCRGFFKKCHQIAVALRVSYGNAMAAAMTLTVMVEMAEDCLFFLKFLQWVMLGWPDPTLTRFSHAKGVSSASRNNNTRTTVAPRECDAAPCTSTYTTTATTTNSAPRTSNNTTHTMRHPAPAYHAREQAPSPCTQWTDDDGDGGNSYSLWWQRDSVFVAVAFFCFVWHPFYSFGSAFFFFFSVQPFFMIFLCLTPLFLFLWFYPFVFLNSWMSLFGVVISQFS